MNRKALAALVVVILGISVVGILVFTGSNESRFAETNILDMTVRVTDFEESVISITFVDDPLLSYRFSYELVAGSAGIARESETESGVTFSSTSDAPIRAGYFNLTLGSASHYQLFVGGINNTISITYANNASVSGQLLMVSSPDSVLYFTFTEDVSVEDTDFEAIFSGCSAVVMNVDLPSEMNGLFEYTPLTTLDVYLTDGWDHEASSRRYVTDSITSPKLNVNVVSGLTLLWLRD